MGRNQGLVTQGRIFNRRSWSERGLAVKAEVLIQFIQNRVVQGRYSGIIEMRGHGRVGWHVDGLRVKRLPVALNLFAYITKRILASAFFKFVEGHKIGGVEHPDFFKLCGCPELLRHYIDRQIGKFCNFGVALPDPGGFQNNQIKS